MEYAAVAKHLTRDLEHLQQQILSLAALVDQAVDLVTQALMTRDCDRARQVIEGDNAIDELENQIQEECLKLLALHQPVAGDLRVIAAVFYITTDLERIGDLATDIGERVLALAGLPVIPIPEKMQHLADFATSMVRQSLDAFVNHDSRLAYRVIRLDDEADRLHSEIIAELIATMKTGPTMVESGVSLFSVARHLERISDHATNIAEDVVYLVDGEMVRHRPESIRPET